MRFFACDFWDGTDAQCDLFQNVSQITFPVLLDADGLGAPDMYNCSYHYVIIVDGNGIVQYRGSPNLPVIEAVLEAAVDNLTGVAVEDLPGAAPLLGANYPNPFNPSTRIPYQVPGDRAGAVRLEVLDLRGRVLRTLVDRAVPPGGHEAVFDGRDAAGQALPSGSYLARLTVDGVASSRVMTLVK